MKAVFIDTNYLVALELATEQSHQAAVRHWQHLQGKLPPLITTTYIFDEVMTFFNSRGQHGRAVKVGNSLRSSFVELVHVDEELFEAG